MGKEIKQEVIYKKCFECDYISEDNDIVQHPYDSNDFICTHCLSSLEGIVAPDEHDKGDRLYHEYKDNIALLHFKNERS